MGNRGREVSQHIKPQTSQAVPVSNVPMSSQVVLKSFKPRESKREQTLFSGLLSVCRLSTKLPLFKCEIHNSSVFHLNSQPSQEVSLDMQISHFFGCHMSKKASEGATNGFDGLFSDPSWEMTISWNIVDNHMGWFQTERLCNWILNTDKAQGIWASVALPSCNGTPILDTFYWLGRIIESNSSGPFFYELFEIWSMMLRMSVLPDCHLDSELHEFSLYVTYI